MTNLSIDRPCSECEHYEKRHDEFPCVNCDGRTDYFNAEVTLCQWIPCSERLPEEKGDYLVSYGKNTKVFIERFDGVYFSEWHYFQQPKAWMPLPDPYKESED